MDDNFVADRRHAMAIMEGLIPLGLIYGCLATANVGDDPEVLDLMARSGCLHVNIGMESIDPETLAIRVSCGGCNAYRFPGKLSSLIMVASDCAAPAVLLELPESTPGPVRTAVEEIARRNPIVTLAAHVPPAPPRAGFGGHIIGRDGSFICVRRRDCRNRYSILISTIDSNVDRAARCAYLIASVLGFSEAMAFEIRLSVYELLDNIFEHGLAKNPSDWVQVDLDHQGDALVISFIDRGAAFDPSGGADFAREAYIAGGKRRGLGLIMTRRIAEQITYERKSGFNKVILRKSVLSSSEAVRSEKEKTAMQFETSEPRQREDGSWVIALKGDLDAKGSLVMERLLAGLLEKKIARAALDFKDVQFISSAGIGILLGIVSSLRDGGGDAVFMKVNPRVRAVFRLLNLEDYFTMTESVETSA